MSNPNHDIQLALRLAAGHERAALAAEETGAKQYEMKMKSAGASAYEAFTLAIRLAPEYQGRKIDASAVERIYQSNKPRPWWDAHLAQVRVEGKPASREWAKRTIQWHMDPAAAKARRAHGNALSASNYRKLQEKSARQGNQQPRRTATDEQHSERITSANTDVALAGRELPSLEKTAPALRLEDLLGEVNRLSSASRKVKPEHRSVALDILRTAARELEELV